MEQKLSTNAILEKWNSGESVDEAHVDFIDHQEILDTLYQDIISSGSSVNSFANRCLIYPSHLHDFLNGKKKLGRDNLVIVCIVLGYDIQKTQRTLQGVLQSSLYARNARDFQIMDGIRQKKSPEEINRLLIEKELDPLFKQ